ncbi:MAG: hypothetical protein JWO28_1065 [Hyphomicrobiales bacterium]|nr:hypothetical protein [Hyphomicrobiales bacterium]
MAPGTAAATRLANLDARALPFLPMQIRQDGGKHSSLRMRSDGAASAQATTSTIAIIPLSSWSTAWQ